MNPIQKNQAKVSCCKKDVGEGGGSRRRGGEEGKRGGRAGKGEGRRGWGI